MRAAIDYMYYVDNFFNMKVIKREKELTYLVHSSTGITRDNNTRREQLNMHDYAMHTLWSYYVTCTIDQIHAIRTLFVTNEFSKKREVLEKPDYINELKKVIERMQVSIRNKQTKLISI